MRIVLSGPAHSGKTTLARILAENGFVLVDYTGYIKRAASKAIFDATGAVVTHETIEANKKDYRTFLQSFCEIAGFNDGAGVEEVLAQTPGWQDAEHVVFDNVRFSRQLMPLMPHGFILVTLIASESVCLKRAMDAGASAKDFEASSAHPSEMSYPVGTIMLNAEKPQWQIAGDLLSLVSKDYSKSVTINTP